MERLPNKDALQLLERMRGKMLMLYPPIDIASDEMMQGQQTVGTYAIGYSLREQYWDLWNDWEELGGLIGLEHMGEGWSPAMHVRRTAVSISA